MDFIDFSYALGMAAVLCAMWILLLLPMSNPVLALRFRKTAVGAGLIGLIIAVPACQTNHERMHAQHVAEAAAEAKVSPHEPTIVSFTGNCPNYRFWENGKYYYLNWCQWNKHPTAIPKPTDIEEPTT